MIFWIDCEFNATDIIEVEEEKEDLGVDKSSK
jgi:hypothetical protein